MKKGKLQKNTDISFNDGKMIGLRLASAGIITMKHEYLINGEKIDCELTREGEKKYSDIVEAFKDYQG